MEGISFALTALFIVLMIEQIFRIKKPGVFIVSALAALLAVFLLPERITLLAGMVMALLFSFLFELCHRQYIKGKKP
jgi:predicted branched-subunit amino acid permease